MIEEEWQNKEANTNQEEDMLDEMTVHAKGIKGVSKHDQLELQSIKSVGANT